MWGGLGNRKFYVTEIDRIERKWSDQSPKSKLTNEEIEAGYDRLAKTFGFYRTLLFMEKKTPYKRDELLKWSVQKFKHNLLFLSWESYTDQKFSEILEKKKKWNEAR